MIISSELAYDVKQVDGRFSVRERHVAEDGREHTFDYMCGADFDKAAKMQANAQSLNEQILMENENGVD